MATEGKGIREAVRREGLLHRMYHSGSWTYFVAAAAFGGLLLATLIGFDPTVQEKAGSDFKTVYASAWCFARGIDGYSMPNIARVFHLQGVVEPRTWYSHAPVYPPFTIALLAPLTLLPMVPALYVWLVFSVLCIAAAAGSLSHLSGNIFGNSLRVQTVIVVLFAASPLISMGIELVNVSVVSVALCLLAITNVVADGSRRWSTGSLLAIAFLLKPHIAIWVLLALLLMSAGGRKIVSCAGILILICLAIVGAWAAYEPMIWRQFESYRAIVAAELAGGSMSPQSRDLLDVKIQITSLANIVGYWTSSGRLVKILNYVVLIPLGLGLVRVSWGTGAKSSGRFFYVIGAWSAFGLVATYHRGADAMILVALLPAIVSLLPHRFNPWGWGMMTAIVATSFGPSVDTIRELAAKPGRTTIVGFLCQRQAAIAEVLLISLLLWRIVREKNTVCDRSEAIEFVASEPGQ